MGLEPTTFCVYTSIVETFSPAWVGVCLAVTTELRRERAPLWYVPLQPCHKKLPCPLPPFLLISHGSQVTRRKQVHFKEYKTLKHFFNQRNSVVCINHSISIYLPSIYAYHTYIMMQQKNTGSLPNIFHRSEHMGMYTNCMWMWLYSTTVSAEVPAQHCHMQHQLPRHN